MTAEHCTIVKLAQLISTSVSTLERISNDKGMPLPDLDSFRFDRASEAFRSDSEAAEAAKVAAAACMHLCAILRPPTDTLYNLALGEHHSFAVRVCLEANVTEILREAGPKGLHIDEISAKCGIDSSKLGRIIRYLVIHHVYRELKPNVFTNNRVSATMDTGKPSKDIVLNPDYKYDCIETGFPALLSHHLDIDHKSTAVAWEVIKDPVLGHSDEIVDTVFSHGLKTDLTYWKFLQHPDNVVRHRRFGFAMQGMKAIETSDMILKAFDWESLPKDALIIDVGGGIGITSMPLARTIGINNLSSETDSLVVVTGLIPLFLIRLPTSSPGQTTYPNFNIIIQDLPAVVQEARKYWSIEQPDPITSGKVKIEVQDFFTPQQVKDPSLFIVKYILHNWPRPYMAKILRRLREAASPDTVLIVIDNVLPYACREPPFDGASSPTFPQRTEFKIAPEPLLPNYGAMGHNAYTLDLTMMLYFNAQEHTVAALKELLESTGWKLNKFHSIDPKNPFLQSVEALAQ